MMVATTTESSQLDEARRRFGTMLLNWRRRYGWSGKTLGIWAAQCPEQLPYKVSSATWTGFELGRAHAPAPETFLGFEAMNLALASGNVGPIRDRALKERVQSAQPFLDEHGEPWRAGDFFDAFIGVLSPPDELLRPTFDGQAMAGELRRRLGAVQEAMGLPLTVTLLCLLRELVPAPAPQTMARIEEAVLSRADLPDAETAAAAMRALEALEETTLSDDDGGSRSRP